MRYLESRPSIKEMKVLSRPMSYLYESRGKGCVPDSDRMYVDMMPI
jgi:hypothetical protein